jgi:putative membrane protein
VTTGNDIAGQTVAEWAAPGADPGRRDRVLRWWASVVAVLRLEVLLLRQHRRLAAACVGLLFVPALYALIYLYAVWDPAAHTRALPAGLVNADTGARYRDRELNLGQDVLEAIERHGQFSYRRYTNAEAARRDVRDGRLAFLLEIPPDFSRQAVPGEREGAAKLSITTSEGNNYSAAGLARRFAPEVAQRVNTMLGEARWELVLSTAAGSQRNLQTLHLALADLHQGAGDLSQGLRKAGEGSVQIAKGTEGAAEAAQRLRGGAAQLAEAAPQLAGGVRQVGPLLRGLEARRPSDAELQALRTGMRQLTEGQRELGEGLGTLAAGSGRLGEGLATYRTALDDVPLFGGRLQEGLEPIEDGARQLATGLEAAREGSGRLLAGALRADEAVAGLVEGTQRAGQALAQLGQRLPEEQRLDAFVDGSRELSRGSDALASGLRQLATGQDTLQSGLLRLADGAGRLDTGLELLRRSLPVAVDSPGGSARGLAASVEPVIDVLAPVPNNGTALTPNFVPLALWVGAVMTAFLMHWRRLAEPVAALPHSAQVAGKLALPLAMVLVQALLMLAMLVGVLHVPVPRPGPFVLTLLVASATFLLLVFALVRLLGDLGKVVAVLLLIVQVSAAGALLPIELSDEAFQAVHPYLPLTWVVKAFRASLFGAYGGDWLPALARVMTFGAVALLLALLVRGWRAVPLAQWRPPLDIE